MKKIISLFLIIFLVFVLGVVALCGVIYFTDEDQAPNDGEKTYLLKGENFSNGNWKLIIDNHIDKYMYINDSKILNKFRNEFIIIEEREAYFTTPDYTVNLYKDGKVVKICAVNDFKKIRFGELEKYFIKVKRKEAITYDKEEYNTILSELKSNPNVIVIKPKEEVNSKDSFCIVMFLKREVDNLNNFKESLSKQINVKYSLSNPISRYCIESYYTSKKDDFGIVISIYFYKGKFKLEKLYEIDITKNLIKQVRIEKKLIKYLIEYEEKYNGKY